MGEVKKISSNVVLASMGLAFFYVWLVTHVDFFTAEFSLPFLGGTISSRVVSDLMSAAALFVLFLLYWKRRVVPRGTFYFVFMLLLLAAGYCLGYMADAFGLVGISGSIVGIFHYVLTNTGMALLSLEWIRLLGSFGLKTTVTQVIIFASALAAIVLAVIPSAFYEIPFASFVFPFGSWALLAISTKRRKPSFDWGRDSELDIPYRLLVTVFVSDFACGTVLCSSLAQGVGDAGELMNALAYGGTAVLMLITVLWLDLDFNGLIYRVAYVIMAVGCLLMVLPGVSTLAVGLFVDQIGYRFMLALTWTMSVWLIDQNRLSANWVYPLVTCFAFLGQLTGNLFSTTCSLCLGDSDGAMFACLFAAVLLPVAGLFLMDTHNIQSGWGFVRPVEAPASSNERFDVACEKLAQEYHLTPREKDVFSLIAKGYTRSRISETLVVAPETVKSYANKMYAKVGVHSRQEVIDLVEKRIVELENPSGK